MSAQYLLPCTNCDQKIPVAAKHAGGQATCPACQTQLDVPKLGLLRQLDSLGTSKKPSQREPSHVRGVLFSGGLIVAVLAGAAAFALLSMGNNKISNVDIEDEIAKTLSKFDDAPPAELFDEWKIRPTDLGDWQEYDFVREDREGNILTLFSYACMGIGGLGLVMLVASFFVQGSPPPD